MISVPHIAHTDYTEASRIAISAEMAGGPLVDSFQIGFRSVSGRFLVHFWFISGPFPIRFRSIPSHGKRRESSSFPPFAVFSRILPRFAVSRLRLTCLAPASCLCSHVMTFSGNGVQHVFRAFSDGFQSSFRGSSERFQESGATVALDTGKRAQKNSGRIPSAISPRSAYACEEGETPIW